MATPFRNLPEQRRLLDAIAAGESAYGKGAGYDVIYGGKRFESYDDHPRQAIPIASGPNVGKTSSAAGRYQFLAPTWDATAREIGVKDFSPESQDMAAWHLAAKTYESKTGRDLLTDIQAGNTSDIAPALKGVWTSIPGGIEPNQATAGFAGRLGSDAPAAPAAARAGLLAQAGAQPDTQASAQGLLAQLAAPPGPAEGQGAGLLSSLGTRPAPQQIEPDPPFDAAQAPGMRRRPIDLRALQAMIKQPGLTRRAFSWG